jgi:tRNA(fMet)-specific endonuclease VapC
MLYLLDTDHWSIAQQESGHQAEELNGRIAAAVNDDFFVSIPTFHEQCLGAHTYLSRAKNSDDLIRGYEYFQKIVSSYTRFPVAEFDSDTAIVYDRLKLANYRTGKMDLRIAAVALSIGATLLTRNLSDFAMIPGLTCENWIAI